MEQPADRRSQHNNSQPLSTAMSRSNSSHSSVETRLRPKSRGSTASLQSVGVGNAFQPSQQQNILVDQHQAYMQHAQQQMQNVYPQPRPDEMMRYHAVDMAHMPHSQQMMDPGHAAVYQQQTQHDLRSMSQTDFHPEMPHFMQYPNGMPQYQVTAAHLQHMRHHSEQFEGSPAPEDSNNENGGAKRRKGAASSMANEQELNRLLEQNKDRSLKSIAVEVQQNEGSGGKSEKAKQVFAMLWLRENCVRSSSSVRRDRVFARYTERCGNERVPTLNPASFGKLVRIIFPNVQTRRLGVRGESKYHYVDLSLIETDKSIMLDRPGTAGSIGSQRPDSATASQSFAPNLGAVSISNPAIHDSMEIADFPAPSSALLSQSQDKKTELSTDKEPEKMDCRYLNTPTIRIPKKGMSQSLINHLPALRSNLPATMATYLAMPSENSLSQPATAPNDIPVQLPNIHDYLVGQTYDHHCAKLLQDLYRSYCIDIIDAFRKCKEKSFFSHHSAFNGKMTVPVSKVFNMESVAPWIQECDMRMYKQIVKFLAHLAQQDVPSNVWGIFERVSSKLVSHVVAAFEEKCPLQTVAAKIVPAARFATLLKKLHGANIAALKVNQLLGNPEYRTQMWLDLIVSTDPDSVLEDSNPPPESLNRVRGILKHDVRVLLAPIDDDMEHLVSRAENDPNSAYGELLADDNQTSGILPYDVQASSLLEAWIQWLEKLPGAFEGHHPQCMMDWHSRFWRSIMNQIGSDTQGARSYASWWCFESFATSMLAYMTQMEGFLLAESDHKLLDHKEQDKKDQDEKRTSLKRKRDDEDFEIEEAVSQMPVVDATPTYEEPALPSPVLQPINKRQKETASLPGEEGASAPPQITTAPSTATFSAFPSPLLPQDNTTEDSDVDMDELRRGGPLDLPTFRTGLTSPLKQDSSHHHQQTHSNMDDSGIGLILEDHNDPDALVAEREVKKFNRRDWFLSSDPVDAGHGLGVTM